MFGTVLLANNDLYLLSFIILFINCLSVQKVISQSLIINGLILLIVLFISY